MVPVYAFRRQARRTSFALSWIAVAPRPLARTVVNVPAFGEDQVPLGLRSHPGQAHVGVVLQRLAKRAVGLGERSVGRLGSL